MNKNRRTKSIAVAQPLFYSSTTDYQMSKFFIFTLLLCFLTDPILSIVQLSSISTSFPDTPARFSSYSTSELIDSLISLLLSIFSSFSNSNLWLQLQVWTAAESAAACGWLSRSTPALRCSMKSKTAVMRMRILFWLWGEIARLTRRSEMRRKLGSAPPSYTMISSTTTSSQVSYY